jgi:hypothetical protein
MLQEIDYFVETYFIEFTKEDIKESFEILDLMDVDYVDSFMSLLMTQGDLGTSELTDLFLKTLNGFLDSLLLSHGIVLTQESTINFKSIILKAIIDLPYYEDVEQIDGIVSSEEEPNYKLSELIDLVSHLAIMDIFIQIESVNPSLFVKLTETINSNDIKIDQNELDKQSIIINIISKLKKIKEFTQYSKAVGFTLVNNNIVLGSSFDKYAAYADKQFEFLSLDDIAIEVFILLTMSEEGFNNPLLTFRKYSTNLFSDLDKVTKIDIKLNNLIMQFDKELLKNNQIKLSLT